MLFNTLTPENCLLTPRTASSGAVAVWLSGIGFTLSILYLSGCGRANRARRLALNPKSVGAVHEQMYFLIYYVHNPGAGMVIKPSGGSQFSINPISLLTMHVTKEQTVGALTVSRPPLMNN
ncbi:hypothetical protein [Affinibrenneria salicis]|uniref:hypothetical protein n=1 Tax=Affinibrenneria salicis TaxID=2590031 RepID=UPI00168AB47D|nr:hypothetical protein [Affinibrenneria salicis]